LRHVPHSYFAQRETMSRKGGVLQLAWASYLQSLEKQPLKTKVLWGSEHTFTYHLFTTLLQRELASLVPIAGNHRSLTSSDQ
jgi:hypothetical protein